MRTVGLALNPGRRVYRQFGLSWMGQLLVIASQALYVIVVSRLVDPEGFGSYAVAVTVTTMATILAQAGLSQAIARKPHATIPEDRALVSAALIVGFVVTFVVVLSSPLWAALWGHRESAPIVALLAVSLIPLSVAGVQTGILRRTDRVGKLVVGQVLGVVVGMLVGGAIVWLTRAPLALAAAPVLGPMVTVGIYAWTLRAATIPGRLMPTSIHDVVFGAKSTGSTLATYVMYSIPQWVMSVQLGPSTLGNWNRSVVLAQVPAESMRAATLNVAYHRLGRSFDGEQRTVERWTRMVVSALTIVGLATAVILPLLPMTTRIVLGPAWEQAPQMILFVALGAAVSLQAGPLSMGLEATGNFRLIYLSQVLAAAILLASAAMEWILQSWVPYGIGMVLSVAVTFGSQLWLAGRSRLLRLQPILSRLLVVCSIGALLLVEAVAVMQFDSPFALVVNQVLQSAVIATILLSSRRRLRLMPRSW